MPAAQPATQHSSLNDAPQSLAQSARLPDAPHTIVVGGGPVGMRCAADLAARGQQVTVLSAESYDPYNRVRLTPLLGGDVQFGEITLDLPDADDQGYSVHAGQRVVAIDRDGKSVTTADGAVWAYDTLVLATGSDAFVPGIPGRELPGVYTFRTALDASALMARSISARRIAVIGGGLLGLEAARGMRNRGCDVVVIEHEPQLMPRQLDIASSALLAERIEALGVEVCTGIGVKEIKGGHKVEELILTNGDVIDCDTVIICTGVRANTWLAGQAGLAFARGIVVNDQMQTSDPDIYAVGECCEHKGRMYGLVGPGYAQADVAAKVIADKGGAFETAEPATKLKVIGAEVFSAGEIESLRTQPGIKDWVWKEDGVYRRIFVERGRLAGAVSVGGWGQASRMQDAVQQRVVVYPWMLHRFRRTGNMWLDEEMSAAEMPDTAIMCNCTGVTCGQLREAQKQGCASVPDLGVKTGAGTVCGTCQPLLEEFLDSSAPPKPAPLWRGLVGLSAVALFVALLPLILGYVPLPESYDRESLRVWLWRDNIVKQWSGFILLGITLAAFVIGLRKRLRFMDKLGSYDIWRLVHLVLGGLALAGFVAHTGMRLGNNLNLWLGASFIATIAFGAISGLATGADHELRARRIGTSRKPARRLPVWVHILALWPLPVLIAAHVLTSYAF